MNPGEPEGPVPAPDSATLESLRLVVAAEARRTLAEGEIAPDPARLAAGWERRFVADRARVAEVLRLYEALGLEAAVDPVGAADLREECGDCRLAAQQQLQMVYTRPRGAHRTPEGGSQAMDPIQQLLEEHRSLMGELEPLRAVLPVLRRGGEAATPAALPAFRSAAAMMATRLLRHARKEDEALFPAVEKALGETQGPTAVMREEHRAIHEQARIFRETLRQLHEVEHPAIVAGGETLRAIASEGASAATLAETGAEILALLDLHFGKEEEVLFPMARTLLSASDLAQVRARFEAIEAEEMP